MKVIIDSDRQETYNPFKPTDLQIKEVLDEAGCKEMITGYYTYENPFGQTVAVVEKMPRSLRLLGITWKEIK